MTSALSPNPTMNTLGRTDPNPPASNFPIHIHDPKHDPALLSSLTSSTTDLPLSSPSTDTLATAAANPAKSQQHSTTIDPEKAHPHPPSPSSPPSPSATPLPGNDPPPEGGLGAWLTVVGSFSITTAVYGLSNSVGVIQPFWARHQLAGFAVQDIAWISGANIFLCLFLGVQVGPWFDRFGPRWVLAGGSVVYIGGLVGLGLLPQDHRGSGGGGGGGGGGDGGELLGAGELFALLMVLWGVVMGIGAALCCTVALSVLAHWFEKRRGLAAGIVFVGSSVGGAIFPLVLRSTLEEMGWAWSMRILAFIVAALLGVGNVLIRGRIKGKKGSGTVDFKCFRDWRFVWTTIGVFMNQFILIAGLGMVPTWAMAKGFAEESTYIIIAVMSGGSGVGRLAAGAISDQIGRFNTMILTTIFSIVTTFAIWIQVETHRIWLFYLFAALFGFGTGCVISLGPVCVGQLTDPGKFGQYYGTSYSVASLSSLLCIPLSAVILDSVGTQGFVLIFGAVLLVALAAFTVARFAIQNYAWRWIDVV
ncbi:Riboflavin transporter MCH5 [Madurella fahalii]|uniref:Riboflavin transporter MCH5 n=1 Tax=Madurella fahalii TaxID=1157608 RepID=A0ABQ0GJ16_9PEZI